MVLSKLSALGSGGTHSMPDLSGRCSGHAWPSVSKELITNWARKSSPAGSVRAADTSLGGANQGEDSPSGSMAARALLAASDPL